MYDNGTARHPTSRLESNNFKLMERDVPMCIGRMLSSENSDSLEIHTFASFSPSVELTKYHLSTTVFQARGGHHGTRKTVEDFGAGERWKAHC